MKTHVWNVTPKEAILIQKKLQKDIHIAPLEKQIKTIAGCDISFNRFSNIVYAGFIVCSYPELTILDQSVIKTASNFPYIPGLLSFREIPALLEAWDKLKIKPDLVMVDGQGICHPRRLGIATHFGLITDIPTLGAAKSILTGTYKDPENEAGSYSYIYDKEEVIGAAVRTKRNVKPMIISAGHKIDLKQSIEAVMITVKKHRMPEPTRLAHLLVNTCRKNINF